MYKIIKIIFNYKDGLYNNKVLIVLILIIEFLYSHFVISQDHFYDLFLILCSFYYCNHTKSTSTVLFGK